MRALEISLIWFLAIGACACFAFFGDFAAVYAYIDSPLAGWNQLLNLSANSYHPWREDHALASLFNWLLLPKTEMAEALFYGFFLSLASAAYIASLEGETYGFRFLGVGLLFSSVVLLLLGGDTLVLSALCYFIFLLLALEKAVEAADNSLLHWVLVTVAGALLAQATSYVAPLLVLLAVILYARKVSWLFLIIPGALSLGMLFIAPSVSFPSYPLLARVVPDDGIEGMLRPLVGADSPLPIIDREFSKSTFPLPSLVLALLCVLTFCIASLREHHTTAKRLSLVAALLAMALLWDAALIEELSVVGPLATIKRVVPGGVFFVFLNSLWFSLSLLLLLTSAALMRRHLIVTAIAVSAIAAPVMKHFMFPGDSSATLQSSDRTGALELAREPGLKKFVVSPSYYVLRKTGAEILRERSFRKGLVSSRLDASTQILTFPSTTDARVLNDGDLSTRWSARPGKQVGDEWIHIQLPTTKLLFGLELATGAYPWDFPRGLQIVASKECATGSDYSTYSTVFSTSNWQGAIKYTRDGYPYFSGQGDVRVNFAVPVEALCLLVRQIGKSEHYDWSVAEIRLLVP